MTHARCGAFVISLDFELYWGLRDVRPLDRALRRYLLAAREAIPHLLDILHERDFRATWATVGFLFARDREELIAHVPDLLPTYADATLSPYTDLRFLGADEERDPFHFAPSLIEQIFRTPGQELGSHTFSHFYALAHGQTQSQFAADLRAAAIIGRRFGNVVSSLVLPRNQWNPAYLPAMRDAGVRSVRVNRSHWAYAPSARAHDPTSHRAFRLVDSALPLSGHLDTAWPADLGAPWRQTASAFHRVTNARFPLLDRLSRLRLVRGVAEAARKRSTFHIWCHPHNFGAHPRTLDSFRRLLDEVDIIRRRHRLRSLTMSELLEAGGAAA